MPHYWFPESEMLRDAIAKAYKRKRRPLEPDPGHWLADWPVGACMIVPDKRRQNVERQVLRAGIRAVRVAQDVFARLA